MNVRLTRMAQSDLIEIEAYIAADNPRRAVTFVEELMAACLSLEHMPERYPLIPDHGQGVRRMAFGNFVIFYQVTATEVQVLTVRHGARKPIVFRPNDLK